MGSPGTFVRDHCLMSRGGHTPSGTACRHRVGRSRFGQRVPFQMNAAERALIARLKDRDEQAFNEVVSAHGDKVFSLVYRMIGNRAEAEDLAQEVFVTVFKTVDTFRSESKFSTWLLRIAANHCKNRIKYLSRRRTDGGGLDDMPEESMADAGTRAPAGPHRRPRRDAGGGGDGEPDAAGDRHPGRGAPPVDRLARRRRAVLRGDWRGIWFARRHHQVAAAPGAHGDQGILARRTK